MKKIQSIAATALLAAGLLWAGCTKDNTTGNNSIIGKWTWVSQYHRATQGGTVTNDTTLGQAGEYVDINSDGNMYTHSWNGTAFEDQQNPYTLSGQKLMLNGGVIEYDIQSLTAHTATLYTKLGTTTNEFWVNLSR
jgi:hypothetical protein